MEKMEMTPAGAPLPGSPQREKLPLRVARAVALGFFMVILAYLAAVSVVSTVTIVEVETSSIGWDMAPAHLLFLLGAVVLAAQARKPLMRADPKKLLLGLVLFTLVAGNLLILITRIEARADQGELIELARRHVAEGDWAPGEYVSRYPHQAGLLFYFMLCTAATHSGAALLVQSLNVAALCGCHALMAAITARLFPGRRTVNLLLILSFCFFPMLLYVTWVYGNLVSLMFGLLGVWAQLKYTAAGPGKTKTKLGWGALCAAGLALSIATRPANMVLAVAVIILFACHAVRGGAGGEAARAGALIMAAVCLGVTVFTGRGLAWAYGKMVGEVPVGVPASSFVSMGLSEGEYAPGWWNSGVQSHHFELFAGTPESRALVDKTAKQEIGLRLKGFAKDPGAALSFFHRKAATMWANPSFQGFWIGTSRQSEIPASPLAMFIYYDTQLGNALLREFADLLQSLILVCALAWAVLRRKAASLPQLVLAVAFVGFFLFHLVWEAKAQYALSYFYLLLPYAAAGLALLADRGQGLWDKAKAKRARKKGAKPAPLS